MIYSSHVWPVRATIADHLYAFARHSGHEVFHVNLALRTLPRWLLTPPPDIVVFDTTFLSDRAFHPHLFLRECRRLELLRQCAATRIALPQDEFLNSNLLGDFIRRFGVEHIFSVSPASEWPLIYPTVDRATTQIHSALTGYLEPVTIRRINRMAARVKERSCDIGYRAWHAPAWVGSRGQLKVKVGEVFLREARAQGLRCDISTHSRDTIVGDRWYEFLLRCKYAIGVEGGASLLDPDGCIKQRTEAYVSQHPQASFEEVEANCFPGIDGKANLVMLSPRHLEACATRTCQVLVEGHYNGILRPWEHYIPVKKDFSNVPEVLALIKEDRLRRDICERAYRDVVASEKYTYRAMVEQVLTARLGRNLVPHSTWRHGAAWYWNECWEGLARCILAARRYLPPSARRLLRRLKERFPLA